MASLLRALCFFAFVASIFGVFAEETEDHTAEGLGGEQEDQMEDQPTEGAHDDDQGVEQPHGFGDDVALTDAQLRALHAKLDGNGDGKASLAEFHSFSQETDKIQKIRDVSLDDVDKDSDGMLSLEEHIGDIESEAANLADAGEKQTLEQRKVVETAKFKAADANGDEKLDKEETAALFWPEINDGVLSVVVAESMRQKDLDKDGKLSPKELWADEQADDQAEDDKKSQQDQFARLDTNSDGSIDLQELRSFETDKLAEEDTMKEVFEVADKDGDSHITADELAAARAQLADSDDAMFRFSEWILHHEL